MVNEPAILLEAGNDPKVIQVEFPKDCTDEDFVKKIKQTLGMEPTADLKGMHVSIGNDDLGGYFFVYIDSENVIDSFDDSFEELALMICGKHYVIGVSRDGCDPKEFLLDKCLIFADDDIPERGLAIAMDLMIPCDKLPLYRIGISKKTGKMFFYSRPEKIYEALKKKYGDDPNITFEETKD